MPDAQLEDLARDIDAVCRLKGSFTLRSGQTADEYFDKYLFESDPALLLRIATRMVDLLPGDADVLAGLELGGVPLATMLSRESGLPTFFVRKQAKTYGTRRIIEGGEPDGRTVVLVEDVITTGGAARDAAKALRDLGATVTTVVCAIDRSGDGQALLAPDGLEVVSVLTTSLLAQVSGTAGQTRQRS